MQLPFCSGQHVVNGGLDKKHRLSLQLGKGTEKQDSMTRPLKPLKPNSRRCVGRCHQGKYYPFHRGIRDLEQAEPYPLVHSNIFLPLKVTSFLMQETYTVPSLLQSPPVVFPQLPRLASNELINICNKQQSPFPTSYKECRQSSLQQKINKFGTTTVTVNLKNYSCLYHIHPLQSSVIVVDLSHCFQQLPVIQYGSDIIGKHSIISHVDTNCGFPKP